MFWQGMAIDEIKEMASRLFCDAGAFFFFVLPRAGPKRQNKNTTTTLRLFQRRPHTRARECNPPVRWALNKLVWAVDATITFC